MEKIFIEKFSDIPACITVADETGLILYVSPFGLDQYGFGKKEITGRFLGDFWEIPENQAGDIISEVLETGSWQGEIYHRVKKGDRLCEQASFSLLSLESWPSTSQSGCIIVKTSLVLSPEKQAVAQKLEKMAAYYEAEIDRYRAMIDASPDPICLTRLKDGRFIQVNQAFFDRTGFTPEQIKEKNAVELNLYLDSDQREQLMDQLKRQGRIENVDMTLRIHDGSLINDLWSLQMIDYCGEPHILVISRSFDELKDALKAVKEGEESYKTLIESYPHSIVVTRRSDARYMLVNEAFSRRTGFDKEEAFGKSPYELGIALDPELGKKLAEKIKKDGRVVNMEIQFHSRDGGILESLMSVTPVVYQGEDCLLTITVGIDELKATEKALKESEERYRNILKNMQEGYWEMDLDGHFTFVNESECRIHRCTKADMIGRQSKKNSSEEDAAKVVEIFKQVYRTGIPSPIYDVEITRKDGSKFILESSTSLLKDAEGKTIGFFGISRDVTEKTIAQKELEQYRKKLELMVDERTMALAAAQKELIKKEKLSVLGQLTATVSHELRNPLGVMRTSNFFLQRKIRSDDEKILKHFKRIDEQIQLCNGIVEDLLEYTRGRKVVLGRLQMRPWLEQLIQEIEESRSLSIQFDFPENLPPIAHDKEKLRRVFINLIENAIHATVDRQEMESRTDKQGTYEPIINVIGKYEDGTLEVSVIDNGIGMEEQVLHKAVEPLFTTRARGTGIGLAIVQKIVADHDGKLRLESTPGKGTTVTVCLY